LKDYFHEIVFQHLGDQDPRYGEEDLRPDVQAALELAPQAGIHSVVCQRIIHTVADAEAQRRAMTEAVI
jgi:hypothetical protein